MDIDFTSKEFRELNERYKKISGDIIPYFMMPAYETVEGLTKKIEACEKAGKDLLPEFYRWEEELNNGIIY